MVVGGRELIDTLWNVNTIRAMTRYMSISTELIDTLWNVNDLSLSKTDTTVLMN